MGIIYLLAIGCLIAGYASGRIQERRQWLRSAYSKKPVDCDGKIYHVLLDTGYQEE